MTNNRKILLLVEDKIKGKRLFTRLLNSYGIFQQHQIVSYKTNIYSLYNSIFRYKDHDYLDILTHLREHEIDHEKKLIFNERYTDIILVFDLDPQEPNFESEKIIKMLEFFNDSTEMGKLYIDYPMIEAFHHMYSLPDPNYYSYFISFNDIKQYKSLIKNIVKNQDHKIFKTSRAVFNIIINQNLEKAWHIISNSKKLITNKSILPNPMHILKKQLNFLSDKNEIAILCTCIFYIADYNPQLLFLECNEF